MKRILLAFGLIFATSVLADTPPPGTVTAKIRDSAGNAISSTAGALNVTLTGGGGGTVDQGTGGSSPWLFALPTGASTSALQTSGNASLTAIDSKLGGTLAVSGTFWQTTQPVSGTLTCNAGTGTLAVSGPLTDAQLRASAVPVSLSGVATAANQSTEITALGTINTTLGSPFQAGGSIGNSSFGISGTLPAFAATPTVNLGTIGSAATAANQTTANSSLASIVTNTGNIPANLTVTSTRLLVDGSGVTQPVSGTFWQATQPVSGTLTCNAGTGTLAVSGPLTDTQLRASAVPVTVSGVATAANQSTQITSLSSIDTKIPASLTVTSTRLLVDGSGVTQPVSGTFWQATQPVSGPLTDAQLRASAVPVSGTFWQATQPVSIATAPALVASSAIIGKVGIDQTTPGTTNGVQVNAALPAGSNVIGHVIADSGSTTAVTSLPSLPAGSAVIGHVIVDTAPTTTVTGTVAATQSGSWSVSTAVPTATTVKQAAITIGTSAVRLTTDGSAPSSTRTLLAAQLLSTSTANCYFGSSGVTSASTGRGVQMFAGQVFTFNNDAGDYYAICDTSSQTFFITEQE